MQDAEAVESAPESGAKEEFTLDGSAAQARLEDQIAWYDAESGHNQRWFKLLKVCQIVVAAAIPGRPIARPASGFKHEKHLFAARAGPYAAVPRPDALLAERVEGLVSQEHAAWVSQREEAGKRIGGGE